MRGPRRLLVLVAAVTVAITGFAVPAHAGPEGTLVARINASRAAAGLAPVESYWDLTDDARSHAARMSEAGAIQHNPALGGVTGVWQALGENVGVGDDANALHDAFMASPSHRANILGDYNYVGVGAVTAGDGLIWVTVIFMRAAPGLNGTPETSTTVATTTTTVAPPPGEENTFVAHDDAPADTAPTDPAPPVAGDDGASDDRSPAPAEPVATTHGHGPATEAVEAGWGHPDGAIPG